MMARPTNKEIIEKLRAEIEELKASKPDVSEGDLSPNHLRFRVIGALKEIVRHPERAKSIAEEALKYA